MKSRVCFLMRVLLVALLAAASPLIAAENRALSPSHGGVSGGFTVMDEGRMQEIIQAAYAKLAQYTDGSGRKLDLEVGPIETFQRDRFEEIRYLDIVDMPEGRVIDVERQSHSRPLQLGDLRTKIVQAAYLPSWRTLDPAWASTDWGREIDRLSVAEVVRRNGSKQRYPSRVEAVSAFTVTATLAGETRTYRAAFFWSRGSKNGQASFIVADNIVQRVDLAASDSAAPIVSAAGPAHLRSRRSFMEKLNVTDATCVASSVVLAGTGDKSGTADHSSGSHASHAEFQIDCACNSDCSATCDSFVFSPSCQDTGLVTSTCHKVGSSSATNSDFSSAGDQVAPQCAAGYGCIMEECFACFCGVSVGVTVSGVNVSFADSSGFNWDGNLSYANHTCPLCQRDTTPPPSGGGGGGGGGGECDEGQLVTPLECVFDCGGIIDGAYCDV